MEKIEIIGEIVVDGTLLLVSRAVDTVSIVSESQQLQLKMSNQVSYHLGELLVEAGQLPKARG